MIKAVVVDLDGVFFKDGATERFTNLLKKRCINSYNVDGLFKKNSEMHRFVLGQISENEFWDYARTYLGTEMSQHELVKLWANEYEVNTELLKCLKNLRGKYLLGCCSNNNPSKVNGLQEKFGFLNQFDTSILSYLEGVVKPHKKIFESMIKQLGCSPEEVLYIDDREDYLDGAKEIGIHTEIYNSVESLLRRLEAIS